MKETHELVLDLLIRIWKDKNGKNIGNTNDWKIAKVEEKNDDNFKEIDGTAKILFRFISH